MDTGKIEIRRSIAKNYIVRSLFFPILSRLNFKVNWKHDVTHRKFVLFSWLHKGYWYYGSQREGDELDRFREFIGPGDCVFEVGGHIGYLSQIFEDLVGDQGVVLVAEPTHTSRKILEKNVRESSIVLPYAMSDKIGEMDFYTEGFGGFTNSLVPDFTKRQDEALSESQKVKHSTVKKVTVPVFTVDAICEEREVQPSFMKIDVEGAEINVLRGACAALSNVRALMVEVSENSREVYELLYKYGFSAKDKKGQKISNEYQCGNIFFYK